ncbi:ankyrin repeat domain-containing protein [Streptomyces sp. NPDC056534]|uniref:ankyrin repeat domain-containing protein n=1 Tax=Streptomyces sp. NPDC056534 TaxID=3345857 RepID=UPI0036CDCDB5
MHREDDPSDHGKRLGRAAESGDTALVAELLAAGADPDAQERYRPTPLDSAVAKGHADVVALLLDAGADPRQYTGEYAEQTPLCQAVAWGYTDVARLLLAAGAPTGIQSRHGHLLPLVLAATCTMTDDRAPLIDLLLEYGADVDDRSMKGETALEWVAGTPHPDTVRHLLARGATPTPAAVHRARAAARRHPELAPAFQEIEEAVLRAAGRWSPEGRGNSEGRGNPEGR